MFSCDFPKRAPLALILAIGWVLSSAQALITLPSSSSLFPLEIFGSQDTTPTIRANRWQQAVLPGEIENPRYSNSSFPGDETGDSPFFYCPESDPETDLFQISKIVLNPNPPRISYVFVFHAHGYFREAILDYHQPFRVVCTVRNEGRNGLDFTFERDLCDFIDIMEMDGKSTICPPFRGNSSFQKYEFVDWGISQGNYSLKIDVRGNGKRVFCVQSWFELSSKTIKTD